MVGRKTTTFVWTERAFDLLETGKLQTESYRQRARNAAQACGGPTCGASVPTAGIGSFELPAVTSHTWQLRDNLTPYDAAYVALAELLSAPLATSDARLARATGPRCLIELIQGAPSRLSSHCPNRLTRRAPAASDRAAGRNNAPCPRPRSPGCPVRSPRAHHVRRSAILNTNRTYRRAPLTR